MSNDLTFFTNEAGASLLNRFKSTLAHVQYFDVLVGYFRTSGFYLLADALEGVEEIRILVGLGVGRQTVEIVEASGQQLELAFQSTRQTKALFADEVVDEMERAADTANIKHGVRTFMQGAAQRRGHPAQHPAGQPGGWAAERRRERCAAGGGNFVGVCCQQLIASLFA